MHTGNATGGHYFSYTKDLASGKWYEFNDSTVRVMDERAMQVG